MHRALLLGLIVLTGCQHTHLRYNTVHQAQTLSDVYEQQVLDNLARTVHDAYAIPSFAYPKDGSTSITDSGGFSASPIKNFSDVFGIDGRRTGLGQWGLTPVSDPDKLQLMQCAYQRAVYGSPLDSCSECCDKENKFEGRVETKLKVGKKSEGKIVPICNPKNGECYDLVPGSHGLQYTHTDGKPYLVDKVGNVTLTTADCNGPCSITCGWLRYGSRCDLPRECCGLIGFHRGTYVWVDKCYRRHLSQLTLKILDYAVNDAPVSASRQKTVELKVDKFGQLTNDDKKVAGIVKATIGIKDQISSAIVIDRCGLNPKRTAEEYAKAAEQAVSAKVKEITKDGTPPLGSDELKKAEQRVRYEIFKEQIETERTESSPTPTEPSKLVTPKRRTIRPSDYGVNPIEIQRGQRALGRQ